MKALRGYERREILHSLAKGVQKNEEEILYALCVEAGKPINDARVEFGRCIDTITLAAEEAIRAYGEYTPLDVSARNAGFSSITRRFPLGLLSFISPFNFPLNLSAHKIAPAIAAGCPFILKPSEKTPISALLLGEELSKLGLPEGAFSILPCADVETASPLSSDPRIKALSFTGSETVGWRLKEQSGRKKVVLELGGNAACIVDETSMDTAEIKRIAARIVFGAFYYSGQSCISVQRVFAHESVYEVLKSEMVSLTKQLKTGDPMDDSTFIGPLISENDAIRVESWVNECSKLGGNILVGGKRDGPFYMPTVIENPDGDCKLASEEIFGPVCTLEKFSQFDDAISRANATRFGLQAGVFTRDIHRVFAAYDKIDAGGVVINDVPSVRVDAQAYGGTKASGVGREGVRFAIQDFTEEKILLLKDIT
eukprot:TRINITY_DN9809_c0_g1_i1.p1 TRINITY_DN9809_c0_g1~~TRINITY_DN9809_c0_g1_i1.p1  ORF type:complete len:436 (+),score=71.51 TRINITY_DN9809_c0_g1_i1:31-1308(+)